MSNPYSTDAAEHQAYYQNHETYSNLPSGYTSQRSHSWTPLLIGASIGAFMGINNLRFPRHCWIWIGLMLFGFPCGIQLLFVVGARYHWNPELVSALFMWTMGLGICVFIGGCIWIGLDWRRQMAANRAAASQAAYHQLLDDHLAAEAQQAAHIADRQAGARETGQAVVDAMRQAYQETQQAPTAPAGASHTRRNVVDVPALPPAPQGPTEPSQRPTGPPPPMGSTTPTLWVPTYSGAAKPVQRIETSLGGTVMRDRRRIDPDEL